jgi:hypothetical protein
MDMIYDSDGNEVGRMPLSEKQRATIETGADVVVIYHTPQMLRGLLGQHNGSFVLRKDGDHIVTTSVDDIKQYIGLQAGIAAVVPRETS